jgi:UDPglucose 6-dehydrogenase
MVMVTMSDEIALDIGIFGFGFVGRALFRFFGRSANCRVFAYDKYIDDLSSVDRIAAVNACDIVFVAVPTPYNVAAHCCDISNVVDAVSKIDVPICIKSTVPPGTVEALIANTGKRISFCPEFIGESAKHAWRDVAENGYVILAGDAWSCSVVKQAYENASSAELRFVHTQPRLAELVKYMDNCFLATKVAFVNQFFDLAIFAGVSYSELRALFVLDPRVGDSHTTVTAERGFGGKCIPKDLQTIVSWAEGSTDISFLRAVARYNDTLRARLPSHIRI